MGKKWRASWKHKSIWSLNIGESHSGKLEGSKKCKLEFAAQIYGTLSQIKNHLHSRINSWTQKKHENKKSKLLITLWKSHSKLFQNKNSSQKSFFLPIISRQDWIGPAPPPSSNWPMLSWHAQREGGRQHRSQSKQSRIQARYREGGGLNPNSSENIDGDGPRRTFASHQNLDCPLCWYCPFLHKPPPHQLKTRMPHF